MEPDLRKKLAANKDYRHPGHFVTQGCLLSIGAHWHTIQLNFLYKIIKVPGHRETEGAALRSPPIGFGANH